MTLAALPLAGADIALDPHWLAAPEAAALHEVLHAAIPWEVHRVKLYGREIDSPRLGCWIGDAGASYAYSGVRYAPRPWPDELRPVRERLYRELDVDFNGVLANLYRDGRDCMGWHSDDEAGLGPRPLIASLSLGATRRFVLKHRQDPALKLAVELPSGSLLLMRGDTQRHYRHALPRTARAVCPRINLTFRRIVG